VPPKQLEGKSRTITTLRPILVIPELNMRLEWVVPERMKLISIVPELILDQCILMQKDLDTLEEWTVENAKKINPRKSKAVRFTRAWVKDPLSYSLTDTLIPEASSSK
jgi:hypothetical protein